MYCLYKPFVINSDLVGGFNLSRAQLLSFSGSSEKIKNGSSPQLPEAVAGYIWLPKDS
jgi:hypothetical protein